MSCTLFFVTYRPFHVCCALRLNEKSRTIIKTEGRKQRPSKSEPRLKRCALSKVEDELDD